MEDPTVEQSKISPTEFMDKIGSLAAGVFILYLMVSFNFIPEIFGCKLQSVLKSSYAAKHFVGLMTVFFFINVTTTSLPWHLGVKFGFSVLLYALFVLSNKSEYYSQVGFMVIVFTTYIMQLVRDQWKKYIVDEKNLTPEQIQSLNDKVAVLGRAQLSLFAIGIFVILFGHIVYIGKKRLEFNVQFEYLKLLNGSIACKGSDPRGYTFSDAFSALFKPLKQIAREEAGASFKMAQNFENMSSTGVKARPGVRFFASNSSNIEAGRQAGLRLSEVGDSGLKFSGGSGGFKGKVNYASQPLISDSGFVGGANFEEEEV